MFSMTHSAYLSAVFDTAKRKKRIDMMRTNILRKFKILNGITIVGTGVSGVATAAILSHELDMPLAIVRKNGDNSHGFFHIESTNEIKEYIIIDDFVCTGATINRIKDKIDDRFKDAECLGVFCVNTYEEFCRETSTTTRNKYRPKLLEVFPFIMHVDGHTY